MALNGIGLALTFFALGLRGVRTGVGQQKWSFVDGTGAYPGIKGSGQIVSNTCGTTVRCVAVLSGTARL